jgi:hypothetical protein
MTYNLVKTSVPSLVDKQLAMKIAKLNNIDYNTGIVLPEPPIPPSQFELLCGDIKESIFLFIRKHIMMILIITGIVILLTIRYFQVKREKKEKEKEKEKEKDQKNQIESLLREKPKNLMTQINNPINSQNNNVTYMPYQNPNYELDLLRQSFNNYDDSRAKEAILNNNYDQWNYSNYSGFSTGDNYSYDKKFASANF